MIILRILIILPCPLPLSAVPGVSGILPLPLSPRYPDPVRYPCPYPCPCPWCQDVQSIDPAPVPVRSCPLVNAMGTDRVPPNWMYIYSSGTYPEFFRWDDLEYGWLGTRLDRVGFKTASNLTLLNGPPSYPFV